MTATNTTNNKKDIIPNGVYRSDKFEYVNDKLRQHVKLANREIDNVKEKVNELVSIVHNDNKDWSLKKICDYIAGRNDDLEEFGFSSRTIYKYLNEENRQLLDTRGRKKLQNNVTEPKFESLQNNVLEESSLSSEHNVSEEEADDNDDIVGTDNSLKDLSIETESTYEPKNWFEPRSPEEIKAINIEKEATVKRKLEEDDLKICNNSNKEKFGKDYWDDKYWDYKSKDKDSFEECSKLFKYHLNQARYEDARAWKYINRMIKIRLDEDPELNINKVIEQVWIRTEDVYGMSMKLIKENLNAENRERLEKEKEDKLLAKGYNKMDLT